MFNINSKYLIKILKQWDNDYNENLYIKIHKSNNNYELLISKYINGKWYAILTKYLFSVDKDKVYYRTAVYGIEYLNHFNISLYLEKLHKWYYETINKYNNVKILSKHCLINNFSKSVWK